MALGVYVGDCAGGCTNTCDYSRCQRYVGTMNVSFGGPVQAMQRPALECIAQQWQACRQVSWIGPRRLAYGPCMNRCLCILPARGALWHCHAHGLLRELSGQAKLQDKYWGCSIMCYCNWWTPLVPKLGLSGHIF